MKRTLSERHALPACLPGFERINRYWDTAHDMPAAKILPGEYYVTEGRELVTTVLGSCVSACIRDRVFGVGGMNHFMLPISSDGNGWNGSRDLLSTATRYGNYAMEHMINDILKHGGHKRHLEAKIFGGGRMMASLSDVGARNIEFVREYLATEGIPLKSESVGDIYPRKIIYIPSTGKVLVKRIKHLHNDTIVKRERDYREEITHQPVAGSVELF
jgi:chemotaxis protein CheD